MRKSFKISSGFLRIKAIIVILTLQCFELPLYKSLFYRKFVYRYVRKIFKVLGEHWHLISSLFLELRDFFPKILNLKKVQIFCDMKPVSWSARNCCNWLVSLKLSSFCFAFSISSESAPLKMSQNV